MLLRLSAIDYHDRPERARHVLKADIEFEGQFTVIEPEAVRTRPLPRVLEDEE